MSENQAQVALQEMVDAQFERAGAQYVSRIVAHAFAYGYTAVSVSEAIMALSEASSEEAKLDIVAAYCSPDNTILATATATE